MALQHAFRTATYRDRQVLMRYPMGVTQELNAMTDSRQGGALTHAIKVNSSLTCTPVRLSDRRLSLRRE